MPKVAKPPNHRPCCHSRRVIARRFGPSTIAKTRAANRYRGSSSMAVINQLLKAAALFSTNNAAPFIRGKFIPQHTATRRIMRVARRRRVDGGDDDMVGGKVERSFAPPREWWRFLRQIRKLDKNAPLPPVWAAMSKAVGPSKKHAKKAYEAKVSEVRQELIKLQVDLQKSRTKIVLILAGVEGAGRGDALNTLMGWFDPRNVETIAVENPSSEERERPFMWRYWRSLPSSGRIGIFVDSWYTQTLREETENRKDLAKLGDEVRRIRHFERLLADADTLVIKVWFDLAKADQGKRLSKLQSDPATAWRVTEHQVRAHKIYQRLARTAEHILAETDRPGARWDVVESADPKSRNLSFAQTILRRFHTHHRRITKANGAQPTKPSRIVALRPDGRQKLLDLPLDHKLSAKEYEAKREKWLGRLNRAVRRAAEAKRSIVFVFEGQDAAGKGGAIRRLTSAMDARDYRIISVAKPTDEEKNHHYLWRFWRQLPRDGRVIIFDRSWYGRVLVERIEGFCYPQEWRRAYAEINDFEEQLHDHGCIVVKYWLQISKDVQLERFKSREETPHKQHKINDEDWRNRAQWAAYETAVGDMIALTDTSHAPWDLIPANNKRFARLEVLRQAARLISQALDR